jgi:hypothetical protein
MLRLLRCVPLGLLAGCALWTSSAITPPPEDAEEAALTAAEEKEAPKPAAGSPEADKTRRITNDDMVRLAKTDPIAFLEESIKRYEREVKGYTALLVKRERTAGGLNPEERVKIFFREKPFSVRMDWISGKDLASKTLFVQGENDDKLVALPKGLLRIAGLQKIDPTDKRALRRSRMPITEFGIKIGTQNALKAWKAARKRGDLKVVYGGVKRPAELGKRPCWEVKRVGYTRPEDDGITEVTFYFDTENWLQIGSILRGEDDRLIGSYFFRDVKLNPDFDESTFTPEALKK